MGHPRDYWDIMFEDNRLIGGSIWEWADHGIRTTNNEGEEYFAYGGDFGDNPHDWKFCIDGSVYPDRTPHHGLTELKEVIAPVQVLGFDQEKGSVEVHNRYDFIDLSHLELKWTLIEDGSAISTGLIDLGSIGPREKAFIDLPSEVLDPIKKESQLSAAEVEYHLNLHFIYKEPETWQVKAPVCHRTQLALSEPVFMCSSDGSSPQTILDTEETKHSLKIEGDDFLIDFNKVYGTIDSYRLGDTELIAQGPTENFWRAPTDNDEKGWTMRQDSDAGKWRAAGLDMLWRNVTSVKTEVSPKQVTMTVEARYGKPTMYLAYETTTVYTVSPEGKVNVNVHYVPHDRVTTLPRLGITMQMPEGFEAVKWYGCGPQESYIDRKESAFVGRYQAKVDDLFENYVIPQENGNRTDTRWVQVTNEEGKGLCFTSDRLFDHSVQHYTAKDIETAMHPYELRKRQEAIVNIDYAQSGICNASCGREILVLDKHALKAEVVDFEVVIVPVR